METLTCNNQNTFISNSDSEHKCGMSSVIVCPNCRSTLSPCVAVPCCPATAPSAMSCQFCYQGTQLCMAHMPVPYVCRHWLQVPHSEPCTHANMCNKNSSQLQCAQKPKPLPTLGRWPSQYQQKAENVHKPVRLSPSYQGPTKDSPVRFSVSPRGGSPEGTIILPNVLLPFNGFSLAAPANTWTKEDDARVLSQTKEDLEESGWYYGSMSWQDAAALLANTSEGTFLVRDSSSSHCPYALSVQTPEGPTSIRVEYEQGKFWLACEKKGVTPQLNGVIELVEFYRALARSRDAQKDPTKTLPEAMGPAGRHVWVDHRGKVFSPITVTQPLKKNPPSLQHLCRLATRSLPQSQLAILPPPLMMYLQKYRHDL